jgi:hypothetical protein
MVGWHLVKLHHPGDLEAGTAGAGARILRSLLDQDDGANQRGALNGRPDETSILSGVEASNGQGNSRHGGQ